MTMEMIKELELDVEAMNAIDESIAFDMMLEEELDHIEYIDERELYESPDAFCDNPGDDQCDCGKSTVSKCVNPNCKDYHGSHIPTDSEGKAELLDGLPF